jgi:large subunit ribosomal protein L16
MLMPSRTKYRKQMKGRIRGVASRGVELNFGEYGLKAMAGGKLTSRQIEAARKSITGFTKRGGRLWIMVFPAKPITKKPLEVRMGKGKGSVDHYVAVVRPGKIIFEMAGVDKTLATEAFDRAARKLPFKTKFISDDD